MTVSQLACRVLTLIMALLLVACRSGDPLAALPPADETLAVQITDDGSKFFIFRREYTEGFFGVDPSRRGDPRAMRADVGPRVEQVLEQTGYCRDGYFELYRERDPGVLSVRGECRDSATATDRQQFPSGEIIFEQAAR